MDSDHEERSAPLLPTHTLEDRTGVPLACGVHSLQGHRNHMEDRHSIFLHPQLNQEFKIPEDFSAPRSWFAVFDGHGGHVCAEYCRRHLHRNFVADPNFYTDPDLALQAAVEITEENFLNAARKLKLETSSGTCAVIAYIERDVLYVANVGDSRAVLCHKGKAVNMSTDHKPTRPDEWKRVTSAGGKVAKSETSAMESSQAWLKLVYCCCPFATTGAMRVYPGGLAVSRTIGDLGCKGGQGLVIPDPEMKVRKLSMKDEFLILACDGVWDVMSSQDAIDIVRYQFQQKASAQEASEFLARSALERGSTDNISALVVRFWDEQYSESLDPHSHM